MEKGKKLSSRQQEIERLGRLLAESGREIGALKNMLEDMNFDMDVKLRELHKKDAEIVRLYEQRSDLQVTVKELCRQIIAEERATEEMRKAMVGKEVRLNEKRRHDG